MSDLSYPLVAPKAWEAVFATVRTRLDALRVTLAMGRLLHREAPDTVRSAVDAAAALLTCLELGVPAGFFQTDPFQVLVNVSSPREIGRMALWFGGLVDPPDPRAQELAVLLGALAAGTLQRAGFHVFPGASPVQHRVERTWAIVYEPDIAPNAPESAGFGTPA